MSTPGEDSASGNENRRGPPDVQDEIQADPNETEGQQGQENDETEITPAQKNGETEIQEVQENEGNGELNNSPRPQTFREKMNMLGGVTSFVKGCAIATRLMRRSSIYNKQSNDDDLRNPLLNNNTEGTLEGAPPPSTPPEPRQISANANESETPQSFTQALVNGICLLFDIGFLTTAYAVKEGGWWSLTLLILFFFIAYRTGEYLMRCVERNPGLGTYPGIGQAAFGETGRKVIFVILNAGAYATCVEYAIMMRDIVLKIWPNAIDFLGIHLDAQLKFVIIGTLLILPTVLPRPHGFYSYLSVGGAGASVVVILCLLWLGAVEGFHLGGTNLDFSKVPISIGIYSFCFANHSDFPVICSSMQERRRFPQVLKASFIVCGSLCVLAAICGFLIFGNEVESQFTLNMTTKSSAAAQIAVWTVVSITISKYALTLNPFAKSVEELVRQQPWPRLRGVEFVIRAASVISTLVVANTFPFDFLTALLGSLFSMIIAVIFPCLCYFIILRDRLNNLEIAICIGIGITGMVIACIGTYSAVATMAG